MKPIVILLSKSFELNMRTHIGICFFKYIVFFEMCRTLDEHLLTTERLFCLILSGKERKGSYWMLDNRLSESTSLKQVSLIRWLVLDWSSCQSRYQPGLPVFILATHLFNVHTHIFVYFFVGFCFLNVNLFDFLLSNGEAWIEDFVMNLFVLISFISQLKLVFYLDFFFYF